MSRVEQRWEHLVRAVLSRARMGADAYGRHATGIAGNVPSSLANNRDIDEILRAADEIQDEDPNISRILCEHAYSLAQNLDPNSEGRGVLQFKTGLMSVIKQKLAKKEGGTIDRSQDIARLQEFYKLYRQKNNVEKLREEEMKLRESSAFSGNLGELERKTVKRKKVFATLRVLGIVLEQLTEEIPEELKRVMESDAAMTEDLIAYNIIPLAAPNITNSVVSLPEVQAAVSALKYFSNLPKLPSDFPIPATRDPDMFDFLYYTFGFQKDNVSNQREHIVHLLANEQSRLRIPEVIEAMAREMDEILRQQIAQPANSCNSENGVSFLDQVIYPLYEIVAAEAANNDNGKAPHSAWRNYDDFNEYFWSLHCFELSWPWRRGSSFFQKPVRRSKGLTIIAFNNGRLDSKCIREVLSLGPTFVAMKFLESRVSLLNGLMWLLYCLSVLDIRMMKALQEESKQNGNSIIYRLYVIVIGTYAGIQFFISFFMRIPACHNLTNQCDRFPLISFFKWMRQERHYVGRGMYERSTDFIKYMLFWLVILSGKFSFAYFLQIKPLVKPTKTIVTMDSILYSWHDFVSKNNHNALTVASLWAPVILIYLLDLHVFYTIISGVWGFLLGARDRLGEIRSLEALHQLFEQFPGAFMNTLHVSLPDRTSRQPSSEDLEKNKVDAGRFSPFWNEIIRNLREEDYITNLEMELLAMPKNSGNLPLVQWPLFLLSSKIFVAKDIAVESRDSQEELWERISRDDYMKYAVQECFHSLKLILDEILEDEGKMWVEQVYKDIHSSIEKKSIHVDYQLNKLPLVISRVTALMGILVCISLLVP
ncbi:hypothetical protein C1H46_012330 [Malus baccata]|uniref:1,3-beta-glucan synthase component FKS1-like domain-containing protein n=1 Tax=Malus baccata TaxID=106549 RepID=A0A540MTC6_MALBA|nr:hypothetical protein C1H46_012330 [Malus baccata]